MTKANNTLDFITAAGTGSTTYSGGGLSAPVAVAVDGAGYIWIANSTGNSVSEFSNAGVAKSGTAGYTGDSCTAAPCTIPAIGTGPSGIAIDNTGGVWVVSATSSKVTHILGVAAPVTTPTATAVTNGTVGTKP